RDAVCTAVPREGRQEPGDPGAARPGGVCPGLSGGGGDRGRWQGFAAVPGLERPDGEVDGQAAAYGADLRAGQAAAQGCGAAATAVGAFVPGDRDHRPAVPKRAAGGGSEPRRACRPADDAALRPAGAEGVAKPGGADFDMTGTALPGFRWRLTAPG